MSRSIKSQRLISTPAQTLVEMLKTRRPSFSLAVDYFCEDFLADLGGVFDHYGNYIVRVGRSRVLWSSHTDTVHRLGGRQKVVLCGDMLRLATGETSNALGADCSTGVWLMSEMIRAGVPGLYIFHANEEAGGVGSDYIATKTPELLREVDFAIAFDRKGLDSVITHQMGRRCCSDAFAQSLARLLPGAYRLDETGSFTDTANYADGYLVAECTNISVGYFDQHSAKECQSLSHALALRETLLSFDETKLVLDRSPGEPRDPWDRFEGGGFWSREPRRFRSLADYVAAYPDEVADLLEHYGLDLETVRDAIEGRAQ